ncbi:hypothetical protein PGT21_020402 [Puccinia graminis f. sp. tritici]|uniref:Uncharacterized protein n=1 Tax=Puccinia graminis f. sp. tritici TaxID=56615 RepID=A0A5B0MV46_PUCGR|nr:hypothetical protein PGT21_020402 [Puccinia graminis f. sp. tritici]
MSNYFGFRKIKLLIFLILQLKGSQCMYTQAKIPQALLSSDQMEKSESMDKTVHEVQAANSGLGNPTIPGELEKGNDSSETPDYSEYIESIKLILGTKGQGHNHKVKNRITKKRIVQFPKIQITEKNLKEAKVFLSSTFPFKKQISVLDDEQAMKQIKLEHEEIIQSDDQEFIYQNLLEIQTLIRELLCGKNEGTEQLENLLDCTNQLCELNNKPTGLPAQFTRAMKKILNELNHNFPMISEYDYHSPKGGEISLAIKDSAFQIIHSAYQMKEINQQELVELISGGPDGLDKLELLSSTMILNYKMKNFKHALRYNVNKFISSELIPLDWQFAHYRTFIKVLKDVEPHQARYLAWLSRRDSLKYNLSFGFESESEIFKDEKMFNEAEYLLNSKNVPIKSSYQNSSGLREKIQSLKNTLMEKGNKFEERLFSFHELKTLENNYPGITLGSKEENSEIKYLDKLNLVSYICQFLQEMNNVHCFTTSKTFTCTKSEYGLFSIPAALKIPNNHVEGEEKPLINYVTLVYSRAHEKLLKHDSDDQLCLNPLQESLDHLDRNMDFIVPHGTKAFTSELVTNHYI